jgi:hypothetical protein
MFDTATGLGTTMVSTGLSNLLYGIAVDATSSKVYISDRTNGVLHAYGAALATHTASSSAPFYAPPLRDTTVSVSASRELPTTSAPPPDTTTATPNTQLVTTLPLATDVPTDAPATAAPVISVTQTLAVPPTPPPPTPPPPTPAATEFSTKAVAKSQVAASVMATVIPAEDAKVVAATSTTAVMASSAINPTAANKGANIVNILSSIQCGFSDDALETSPFEVIIVFGVGSSKMRYLLGGVVAILLFLGFFFTLQVVLHYRCNGAHTVRRYNAIFFAVLLSLFLPTATGYLTTILNHSTGAADTILGLLGAGAIGGAFAWPLYVVARQLPTGDKTNFAAPEEQAADQRLYAVFMLADGCKDTTRQSMRLMFFEDIFAAMMLSTVAGIMPEDGNCTVIALLMAAVSLVHLAYVMLRKPYEARVDTIFSMAVAIGQFFCACAAVVAVRNHDAVPIVGMLAMIQMVLFFAQTLAMAAWTVWETYIKAKKRKAASAAADAEGKGVLTVPLIQSSDVPSPRNAPRATSDGLPSSPLLRSAGNPYTTEVSDAEIAAALATLQGGTSRLLIIDSPPPPPPTWPPPRGYRTTNPLTGVTTEY